MNALLAQRSLRLGMAASALLGIVLAFQPLFGVHGVESALVLGAVLPLFCAAIGARIAIAARARGASQIPAGDAVVAALLVLALPTAILALNALRVRNCAPLEGLAFIALGPLAGVILAALVGACVGALPLRPAIATWLAALVPLCDMLRAVYDFYATPAIFAYGHFFGYFPGALYDELVELPGALFSLRALSASLGLALLCLLACHYQPALRALGMRPQPGRARLWALGLASGLLFLIATAKSEALGHRASVASIEEALGSRVVSARCELIVPREYRSSRRKRLAEDCDFRVRQMERWFGVRQPDRVRVFLFRSAGEKRVLMGAGATNIAKPWRDEIYLQDDVWPHPVMPHEIAHIVAGNVGQGPLRISGKLSGLLPDFALIEGVAVAAAWPTSSAAGLTAHQWTRAMYELDLAPDLTDIFGTGFLGQNKRVAYTVTGSLMRFIAETHGSSAVRRIYQSGDVLGTLGLSAAELQRRFQAYLNDVPLPEGARALAKQRFSGASIFSSVCPHEKAKLKQELDGYLVADDAQAAARTCRQLLKIDPAEWGIRAVLVGLLERLGQRAAAKRTFGELLAPSPAPAPIIAGARHALADEAWRKARYEEAQRVYQALLAEPNDRDTLRMLQVKALAFSGSARQRDLLFTLMVGEPGQALDGAAAVYVVRELRTERSDGLAHYLEARQLYLRERFAEAAPLLATARALSLPTSDLAVEALRVEAICRYGAGERQASRALWQGLLLLHATPALDAEATDWLARD